MIGSGFPLRVQLRRSKGWRLPAGTVVVGRPSRWGNPDPVVGDLAALVPGCDEDTAFRRHLAEHPDLVAAARRDLRGHDLACWCRLDQAWCHADVWLEIGQFAMTVPNVIRENAVLESRLADPKIRACRVTRCKLAAQGPDLVDQLSNHLRTQCGVPPESFSVVQRFQAVVGQG
jgi:hypothetical protein